jgi:hypothetical protein
LPKPLELIDKAFLQYPGLRHCNHGFLEALLVNKSVQQDVMVACSTRLLDSYGLIEVQLWRMVLVILISDGVNQ